MDLTEAVEAWIEAKQDADRYRPSTIESYRRSLAMFAESTTTPDTVEAITPDHIRAWRRELKQRRNPHTGEPIAASTVANRMAALGSFLAWCDLEDVIPASPMGKVEPTRVVQHDVHQKHVEPHQVRQSIGRADPRTRLLVLLAVHCGLRRGELARLRCRDVTLNEDRTAGVVTVADGKGGHSRSVPMVEAELVGPLVEWLDGLPLDADFVFPSRKGGHLSPDAVGRLVSAVTPGRGVATHTYRHTAAVGALRRTGDVQRVRKFLGHANLQTTQRYVDGDTVDLLDLVTGRTYT